MAALTGNTIASTYKDLLQVSNSNSGIDATLRVVSDGEDTSSPLRLSSTALSIHNITYPSADGTNGQVLTTDGSGTLSFSDVSLTFSADTGSTSTGSLTLAGGANISTTVSGDTITFDATGQPDQNLWETIAADTGSTSAASVTDTLNILGDTNVSTSITGDTLTISLPSIGNGQIWVGDGSGALTSRSLSGGDGIDVSISGSVIITNTSNIFETFAADTGSTTATTLTDTLTILGGTDISTSISGNTLTIEYTGTGGGGGLSAVVDDTTPQLGGSLDTNGFNIDCGGTQIDDPLLRSYLVYHSITTSTGNSLTISDLNAHEVDLDENITSITLNTNTFAGGNGYEEKVIKFKQPDTGSTFTVSGWPSSVKWPGGTAPTITATNGAVDIITLMTWDQGTTWYGNYQQDYS